MDVFEAIKARHSIRQYKSTPVSDSDLNKILEAARLSPSWANTQCWRFIVIKDKDTRMKLAETLPPGNRAGEGIRTAPVTIVACAELKKSGFYKGEAGSDKGDWFMFDVALAMEHICLVAVDLGLGTVHTGLFDAKKAAAILNVPEGYAVVEMTPLGYPESEGRPVPRKELSEIVFYEKFGTGK